MTNNNKKKNWIRTVIVIVVGLFVTNLLLSFVIGAKAAEKDDLEYIPVGQFELLEETNTHYVYMVKLSKPLQDITLSLIMIDATGIGADSVYYDEEGSYVTQERFVKDTSYQNNKYNAYSANCIYVIQEIKITVKKSCVLDGLYIIPNNTSVDYNTVISAKLSQLNRQKYIVQTIDIGYDEFNSVHYDSSIIYPYEIYLNQQSRLLFISGQVAITGGVNKYIYTVNNSTPNEITNNNAGQSLTSDFITEVNNANFGITDYNKNANFDFGIVLLSYENQTVSVTISAVDYDGIVYDLIYIPEVHVYTEFDESETETETETDTPIAPGDGSYKDGYDKGYQEAFRDMLNGNLVGGKLEYIIRNVDNDTTIKKSHDIVTAPYADINWDSLNGLNFTQVYETWYSMGGTFNNMLTQTQVHFTNPVFMPFNILTITLPDSVINEGVPKINVYGIIKDSNSEAGYRLVATTLVSTEDENKFQIKFSGINELVYGIEITGIMPSALRYTYLDFDNSVYALNEYSYNEGYNYGLKLGKITGKDIGYKEGYEEGKKIGYDLGVESTNMFYKLFTALFDSFIYLLTSLLSFEVFGVNVLGFLSGIITLIAVLWVIKRLFG